MGHVPPLQSPSLPHTQSMPGGHRNWPRAVDVLSSAQLPFPLTASGPGGLTEADPTPSSEGGHGTQSWPIRALEPTHPQPQAAGM